MLTCRKIICETNFDLSLLRRSVNICPVLENILSQGVEDAGIHKRRFISW